MIEQTAIISGECFEQSPEHRQDLRLSALRLYQEAARISEANGDKPGLSFALGYCGHLYEQEKKYDAAAQLTQRAVFLAQEAAVHLKKNHGCIVNMVDIHAYRPLREHTVYCAAKAGLVMLTLSLARELGPEIRVNGVAPGANVASKFQPKGDGVWELPLDAPLTSLARGKLTVSVKDRQGNTSRIERTFSVAP